MSNAIIYLFPLIFDIIVGLALFVSRHSFAEAGMDTTMVGAVSIIYGIIYILANLAMGKIIKPHLARKQMLVSVVLIVVLLCGLANIQQVALFLVVFSMIPIGTSLFFNSFQSYMLQVDTGTATSLARTAGNYTMAWSMGLALGPIISSVSKSLLSWALAYYAAALLALAVGAMVLLFKPARSDKAKPGQSVVPEKIGREENALPLAGWWGCFVLVFSWMVIATYWPVQANKLGYSTMIKGVVEFVYAITQALTGFLAGCSTTWFHRPPFLLLIATGGVGGFILFAVGGSPLMFILGAFWVGTFTGSGFTFMVYHALFDTGQAVKRVAINELAVGIGFMAGPFIADRVMALTGNFSQSYLIAAMIVGAGVLGQTILAAALRNKYRSARGAGT